MGHERRRGHRFAPTNVSIRASDKTQSYNVIRVVDLSTVGIGIELDKPTASDWMTIEFLTPPVLAGLKLRAQRKRTQSIEERGLAPRFQLGYEFEFGSAEESARLHRWTHEFLKMEQNLDAAFQASQISAFEQPLEIRVPKTEAEYEKCMEIISPLRVHHALIQTKYFIVLSDNQVLALIVLIPDLLDFPLETTAAIRQVADSFRTNGARIGEISPTYFNESLFETTQAARAHLQKLQILYTLFPYIITYAKQYARYTDLVASVPLHLQEFFKLWLFEPQETHSTSNDAIPMHLNLSHFDENSSRLRPELHEFLSALKKSDHAMNFYDEMYYPSKDLLKKWFVEKNRILVGLKHCQEHHFKFLFPNLRSA